eukprot:Awhi_evm1s12790
MDPLNTNVYDTLELNDYENQLNSAATLTYNNENYHSSHLDCDRSDSLSMHESVLVQSLKEAIFKKQGERIPGIIRQGLEFNINLLNSALLLSCKTNYNTLASCILQQTYPELERMLNVDATDDKGWTSLHWASASGNIPLVELLLEKNANHSALTPSEKTPLDLALLRNNQEAAVILMKMQQTKLQSHVQKQTQTSEQAVYHQQNILQPVQQNIIHDIVQLQQPQFAPQQYNAITHQQLTQSPFQYQQQQITRLQDYDNYNIDSNLRRTSSENLGKISKLYTENDVEALSESSAKLSFTTSRSSTISTPFSDSKNFRVHAVENSNSSYNDMFQETHLTTVSTSSPSCATISPDLEYDNKPSFYNTFNCNFITSPATITSQDDCDTANELGCQNDDEKQFPFDHCKEHSYSKEEKYLPSAEKVNGTQDIKSALEKKQKHELLQTKVTKSPLFKLHCTKAEKRCSDCETTNTPQWRRGKNNNVLCNACGLKFADIAKRTEKKRKKIVKAKAAGNSQFHYNFTNYNAS